MTQRTRHRVAVLVLVDAEGEDHRDSQTIGVQVVQEALDRFATYTSPADGDLPADPDLVTHTYLGQPRTARVVEVTTVGQAIRAGAMAVTVAAPASAP